MAFRPFRRRLSKPRSCRTGNTLARVARATLEPLEKRQLLTALVNGTFQGTGTIYDGQSFFEYRQPNGDAVVRISVTGNITAEFIGGRVSGSGFALDVTPADLVPASAETSDVFLFSIYVLRSDINSAISIAQMTEGNNAHMDPQTGTMTLRYANAINFSTEGTLELTGGAFIGALTSDQLDEPFDSIPVIQSSERRFGMRPASAGPLYAGLQVAAGQDLGKFFLGGTITGRVNLGGSMETFYANNILTGDAAGIPQNSTSSNSRNFYVARDLRNLLTLNSFGTLSLTGEGALNDRIEDFVYKTGFDLEVGGKIGQIKAIDSFLGQVTVINSTARRGPGINQKEIERKLPGLQGALSYFDPSFFGYDIVIGGQTPLAAFYNDTFDSAQYLGTAWNSTLRSDQVIELDGVLDGGGILGPAVDYYAFSLLAGQTVEVRVLDTPASVGIYDPDGRLIMTDYSNIKQDSYWNQPMRFTADRPGAYRVAIARRGDINFNGVLDGGESQAAVPPNYRLRILNVGDLALGGLIAENHIATTDFDNSVSVLRGDLGAVRAGTLGAGTIFSLFAAPWVVRQGNLRSMEALSIGIIRQGDPNLRDFVGESGPDLLVPRGSIGLIRTTGLDEQDSVLTINDDRALFPTPFSNVDAVSPSIAVGRNIQLVESGTSLSGNLLANGAIGMIRAARVVPQDPIVTRDFDAPVWLVNVDKRGSDGIIDLIDITGDFGTLREGGPSIATGPNGNVRYIRVGGQIFNDRFFGGGQPAPHQYDPGEIAHITDDSGTEVTLIPVQQVGNPGVPGGTGIFGGSLTVQTYPIRGKAGVVITDVLVTPGIAVGQGQVPPPETLVVRTGARGRIGSAEIGQVTVAAVGTPYTFNPAQRTFTQPLTGVIPIGVFFRGRSPIDVWSINSPTTNFTNIVNDTTGEIVNVLAADINLLEAETIGLARSTTGAAVNGATILTTRYPFNQQRNLVQAIGPTGPLETGTGGDIITVRARRGLGNIAANGTIGTVEANSDRKNVAGVLEGINGPIYALHTPGTPNPALGNILTVNVGEGLPPSGSGDVGFSGIFAENQIDSVVARGMGHDIRGDIVAANYGGFAIATDPTTGAIINGPTAGIGQISLKGGASIIDADIMVAATMDESRETINVTTIPELVADNYTTPIFDIGGIRIDGPGGIIGTYISAADHGPITITGGFGVINSSFNSLGSNIMSGIVTDGYGIRDTMMEAGGDLRRIVARGDGRLLSTLAWTDSVRQSETSYIDKWSGRALTGLNDLHRYLGTTKRRPRIGGLSASGVIEDSTFVGALNLGTVQAYRIVARDTTITDPLTGQTFSFQPGSSQYPMRINFPNHAGSIVISDQINGLSFASGGLDRLSVRGDVTASYFDVAGRIKLISAGTLRGNSYINANGPEGQIDSISTRGSLFATVIASQDIRWITIGRDFGSPLLTSRRNVRLLSIGGSMLTGSQIDVRNTIFELHIGRDIRRGARLKAGAIVTQDIGGQVIGDLVIS